MGKKIDRFVLTSVLAAALFFYFESSFHNGKLAIILALFCCIIIVKALRRLYLLFENTLWQQKRSLRRKSSGMLMQLASMQESEAAKHIQYLLHAGYAWDEPTIIELQHPSLSLSRESVFSVWRNHRGTEKLVLCTTGKCSSEARVFASSLKSPKIAVVDADILSHLLTQYPSEYLSGLSNHQKRRLKLENIMNMILNRRNAPRSLLFSFAMLVMYIFSASKYYLAGSMILLFVVLVSLRRTKWPAKLF